MLELPPYRWPSLRNLVIGLWERAHIFLGASAAIILSLMVVLWFLSQLPGAAGRRHRPGDPVQLRRHARPGAASTCSRRSASTGRSRSRWSRAWRRARWRSARSGTVYALSAAGDEVADALAPMIAQGWSLATAYSLLAWYVFAPQCISTLAW